ncbi:MAG: class I SAM-dependent methyltransferase [Pseudomonadota bacterium]
MRRDASNGYEDVADAFIRVRSSAGVDVVRAWAAGLPRGGTVLDVGAGSGEPLSVALAEAGLRVSAVDAAPSMAAAFRRRLPGAPIACEPAERSRFFGRRFNGVLAVGLVFLLPAHAQPALIRRLAGALMPGGRLLFSAPKQTGAWTDLLTGRRSASLGAAGYGRAIARAGLRFLGDRTDEQGNAYYAARRRPG